MTAIAGDTIAAYIDTAYFHAAEPFDGREDDPKTDAAATKIWAGPCGIGDGWDIGRRA